MSQANQEADLRRMRELHRQTLAQLVKTCLAGHPDPDLRAFAAALPDQVDSVEAYLKRFWSQRGLGPDAVQDFARRYGHALAGCPEFQAFESGMEELARAAGTPEFPGRYRDLAARMGLDAKPE